MYSAAQAAAQQQLAGMTVTVTHLFQECWLVPHQVEQAAVQDALQALCG